MNREDVEATLRGFASLVDVEEALSPTLHEKLTSIAHAAPAAEQAGWEATLAVACVVLVGINVLGADFLSGTFLVTSLVCAGAYALGTRRLLEVRRS